MRRTLIITADIPGTVARRIPGFRSFREGTVQRATYAQETNPDGVKSVRALGFMEGGDGATGAGAATQIAGLGGPGVAVLDLDAWGNPAIGVPRPRWFGPTANKGSGGAPGRSHLYLDYLVNTAGTIGPGAVSMLLEIDDGQPGQIGG